MENTNNTENYYSLYYILATVFIALTAWVLVGTVAAFIIGAILGLLFAAFFVNALVKDRGES